MNTIKIVLGFVLLALSLSFAPDITSCGVISAPGTYTVQNDLTSASGDCLVIQSDDVDLYCDAHTISANDGVSYAIYVTEGSDNVLVDRCGLEKSMVGLRAGGLGTETTNLELRHNVAIHNNWGYELIGVTGSSIHDNTAWENTQHGFYMTESTGNTLTHNQAYLNPGWGFYLGSCSGNTITDSKAMQGGDGFVLLFNSDGNVLSSNVAEDNSGSGFLVSGASSALPEGNQLNDNVANRNDYGIHLTLTGTGNQVSGNTLTTNELVGLLVSSAPESTLNSNLFGSNGVKALAIINSPHYVASDNSMSDSPRGADIIGSYGGTFDNNKIGGTTYGLTIQDSPNSEFVDNLLDAAGYVILHGDSSNVYITRLTMKDFYQSILLNVEAYSGDFELSLVSEPAAAPEGYTSLNKYLNIYNVDGSGSMFLSLMYSESELGSHPESEVTAMVWDGSWSTPAQTLYMGSDGVEMNTNDFGIFALFVGEVPPVPPEPPEPPVTPPSGGGTSGGSSGGSSGGGGAVHIGIPYVPGGSGTSSGSEGGGTATLAPSCTSDSDCGSSEGCSGGVCVALSAGGSCGAFSDHEWVDYECCSGADCAQGEVCNNNQCVATEPLSVSTNQLTGGSEASDEGLGRLLADVPWWVLLLLVLMVGGGIYARYMMGRDEGQPPEGEGEYVGEEELPPAEPEEE